MKLLSILGPTASGKSTIALELAQRFDGEIISCDSMQIYRGLDIGTAKATLEEREKIPHHLIDIYDISHRFSVAEFIELADPIIQDCINRGKQPILCGGTGLYAKALLYGFDFRPRDLEVAAELRQTVEADGPESLIEELKASCPDLNPAVYENPRHWLRALEVLRITGASPTSQTEFVPPAYVAPEYILCPSAELSRSLIRERAEKMLQSGWIEEVKAIGMDRFKSSATASQAIGYSLILDYLDGKLDYEQLVERIVIGTAQFAKRQRTWFRNQHPNSVRVTVEASDDAIVIADRIHSQFIAQ